MRWVKLTFPPTVRFSWSLTMVRLTSRSLAGTTRTLVAVGTPRDASMLTTIRPAAPRNGVAPTTAAAAGVVAVAGGVAGGVAGVVVEGAAGTADGTTGVG